MVTIEERIEKACKDGVIPGAVFAASDREGELQCFFETRVMRLILVHRKLQI